ARAGDNRRRDAGPESNLLLTSDPADERWVGHMLVDGCNLDRAALTAPRSVGLGSRRRVRPGLPRASVQRPLADPDFLQHSIESQNAAALLSGRPAFGRRLLRIQRRRLRTSPDDGIRSHAPSRPGYAEQFHDSFPPLHLLVDGDDEPDASARLAVCGNGP